VAKGLRQKLHVAGLVALSMSLTRTFQFWQQRFIYANAT